MSDSKHTPGPWGIDRETSDPPRSVYIRPCYDRNPSTRIQPPVATVWGTAQGYSAEDNARLIAAAPELLAALAMAASELRAARARAREVAQKALGEAPAWTGELCGPCGVRRSICDCAMCRDEYEDACDLCCLVNHG